MNSGYPPHVRPDPAELGTRAALCHVDLPLVDPTWRTRNYAATTSDVGQVRQLRLRPRHGGWHPGAQLRA